MTAGNFHRLAFAEAGPGDTRKLLEVLEPTISFFMDRHEDERMVLDFALRMMPDAYVSSQWLAGISTRREKAHAACDGNDDLCLLVPRAGKPIQMRLPDRRRGMEEVVLRAETGGHLRGNEESYHAWSLGCDSQLICVPRARVEGAVADLSRTLRHGVPPSGALNLLCAFARTLASDIGPLDSDTLLRARDTLTDLFILALGPTGDAAEAAGESVRTARFARIKADVAANLAHPDFSLEWLAGRHQLSTRAIRDLFYASGTNFTDHVLGARLERAHGLLSDPSLDHLNITAIAYDCGFGDLSWFNQAFRRRYGMTPSDLRSLEHQKHAAE